MSNNKVHFLKKTIQVLIPIYVFFSLFFYQPSLFNEVLNYVDQHVISTFSIKLFHYNTERNYVFLLFNGILAVILKNSGFISKLPINLNEEDGRKSTMIMKNEKKKNPCLPQENAAEFSKVEDDVVTGKVVKKTEENGIPATETAKEEEVHNETEEMFSNEIQVQEEEEEEEHGLMSADELNRKCEEFIKKMKEGIKVKFHHQSISH